MKLGNLNIGTISKKINMPAITDNLMHFLGRNLKDSPDKQFQIFESILLTGLRCSKVQVKLAGGGGVFGSAVCFTDIPLSMCKEHVAVYGKYGIGFKKAFVKHAGGNPARYIVDYAPGETNDERVQECRGIVYKNLSNHIEFLRHVSIKHSEDENFTLCDPSGTELLTHEELGNWINQEILLHSYDKETGDIGPARDNSEETDPYYKEREWRLVPSDISLLSGTATENEDNETHFIFNRSDINVIVTPNQDSRIKTLQFLLNINGSSRK